MVFAVVVAKATKHEVECHIPNQIFFFLLIIIIQNNFFLIRK